MKQAKYENGDLLKDKVTGLEGIVMVVAYYSTGCIHYGIQPQKVNADGSLIDWTWLDESRFFLLNRKAISFSVASDRRSGPMPIGPQG